MFLTIILSAYIVSGCANAFNSRGLQLIAETNFTQLVKEFDPPGDNYAGMPFSQLIYLCMAYAELKDYKKLFPCLDAAQAKVDEGSSNSAEMVESNNYTADFWDHSATPSRIKANALIELGQYEEAVKAAELSYEIAMNKKLKTFDEIKSLEVLGLAYALAGKTVKAEEITERLKGGLHLRYTVLVQDDRNIALAKIYIALKRYSDAINAVSYKFEYSGTFLKMIAGWDVWANNKISFEFMKNKSLFEVGRWTEAKEGYDALLRYPYIRDRGEMIWNILFDRGRIAEKEDKLKEAIEFYEKAVEMIEQQRSTINNEASKIGFVGDKQAVYHSLIKSLYTDHQYEKAFEYVERSKSRALIDLLASKQDFAVKVVGKEEQIRTDLALIGSSEAEAISMDNTVDKSRTRSIAIKAKNDLQNDAPELASLVTVSSTPLSEIKSLIPKGEALIEYYYFEKDMYAFVLSASGLQSTKMSAEGLAEEVAAFRKSLENPDSQQTMELAGKLYQRVFKPLEGTLKERDIVIVPHGILHYVPMNALYNGKDYLIDHYKIRLMPSANALKYLRENNDDIKRGILAFGNPDLGDPSLDLVFAQKEALEVANTLANSKVFLRKEATEDALRRYGNGYNYIHFATHGQFSPDSPLKSAVLLSPDSHSNGLLTVDKLYSMQLGVKLVTLSACETGLSKVANGDELVGLTRGFLYAGASTIVASLWKVDDLATSYLMIRFYQGMHKTNKRDALRIAQLETRGKYPHPYYWASFQLTGSTR
jgi:CHAT domain-containing protein